MRADDALGCPYCQGELTATGEPTTPWRCAACGQRYALAGRCLVLLRREDADRWREFARRYRAARRRDGWRPLSREQALNLPYG